MLCNTVFIKYIFKIYNIFYIIYRILLKCDELLNKLFEKIITYAKAGKNKEK